MKVSAFFIFRKFSRHTSWWNTLCIYYRDFYQSMLSACLLGMYWMPHVHQVYSLCDHISYIWSLFLTTLHWLVFRFTGETRTQFYSIILITIISIKSFLLNLKNIDCPVFALVLLLIIQEAEVVTWPLIKLMCLPNTGFTTSFFLILPFFSRYCQHKCKYYATVHHFIFTIHAPSSNLICIEIYVLAPTSDT